MSLVGATKLVARCRRALWFRATWYVAPTDRCFSKTCITYLHLLRKAKDYFCLQATWQVAHTGSEVVVDGITAIELYRQGLV